MNKNIENFNERKQYSFIEPLPIIIQIYKNDVQIFFHFKILILSRIPSFNKLNTYQIHNSLVYFFIYFLFMKKKK